MQASHSFDIFWTSTLSIFCQCIIALADMLINMYVMPSKSPKAIKLICTTTTFQWLDCGYDILLEVTFIFHGPSLCVECVTHSSVLLPVPLSFCASFTSSKGSVWFLAQLATWLVLAGWRRLGQTLLEYLIYIDIYIYIQRYTVADKTTDSDNMKSVQLLDWFLPNRCNIPAIATATIPMASAIGCKDCLDSQCIRDSRWQKVHIWGLSGKRSRISKPVS